jgi:hypothetical protein
MSLKVPKEKYLSSRPSDESPGFGLVGLHPSWKFFMVPMGAGRNCLKGSSGKEVSTQPHVRFYPELVFPYE